jgi:hypothetical protein
MANVPVQSAEARDAARAKALLVRRQRAELKERLKMGAVSLNEVLDAVDSDEAIARTKVLPVLESLPGLGKVKARRLMEEIGIDERRRLRGLGPNQVAALRERAG